MAGGQLMARPLGFAPRATMSRLKRIAILTCSLAAVLTGVVQDRTTAHAATPDASTPALTALDVAALRQVLTPSPLTSDLLVAISDLEQFPDLVADVTASSATQQQRADAASWATEIAALPTLRQVATPAVLHFLAAVQTGTAGLAAEPTYHAWAISDPALAWDYWVHTVLIPDRIDSCGPLPGPCDTVINWITQSAIPWLQNGPGQVLKGAAEIVGSILVVVAAVLLLPEELTVAAVIALAGLIVLAIAAVIDGIENIAKFFTSYPSPPAGGGGCTSWSYNFWMGDYGAPAAFYVEGVGASNCFQKFPASNILRATFTDENTGIQFTCVPGGGYPSGGCDGHATPPPPTDTILVSYSMLALDSNPGTPPHTGTCAASADTFEHNYVPCYSNN